MTLSSVDNAAYAESARSRPVVLSRQPPFKMGLLMARPAAREIEGPDLRETLEPRIMQVLVVLHEHRNEVVSRDELIARCWQGRIVGDDALHRCIGRLRRIAEASGAFKIDTIHRVGFRLSVCGAADPASHAPKRPLWERPPWKRPLWTGSFPGPFAFVAGGLCIIGLLAAVSLRLEPVHHLVDTLLASVQPYRGPATFTDCTATCPEMVALPPGRVSVNTELARDPWGQPRTLTIVRSFAVSKSYVTRRDYAAFLAETGRRPLANCFKLTRAGDMVDGHGDWRSPGFPQTENDPVVCVSWDDATAYAQWLSRKTGKPYRLLTEAEWRYAADDLKSLASKPGDQLCSRLNGADETYHRAIPGDPIVELGCSDHFAYTSPVGVFPANRFGLNDMLGNVWSWLQDCYTDQPAVYPSDGSAFEKGLCSHRVLRGGSWSDDLKKIRVFRREPGSPGDRYPTNGFRLARDLS